MANPFYVEPTAALQLGGLGQLLGGALQAREAQAQREQALGEMRTALQGGPAAIAEFSTKYPEFAQMAQQQFGFTNDQSREAARQGYAGVLATDDPEQAANYLEEAARQVQAVGGTPTNMIGDVQRLRSGQVSVEELRDRVAFADPELWNAYSQSQQVGQQMDIKQEEIEIKREANRLRSIEARERALDRQLARETNELKRQQLEQKIQDTQKEKDRAVETLKVEGEQSVGDIDFQLQTAQDLLASPGLEAAVGASSIFPTMPGSDAADFERQLEKFQSQQFLNNVKKMTGMGALSEAEGRKIAAAAGALGLDMSEEAFRREMNIIITNLQKAKNYMQRKYGIEPTDPGDGDDGGSGGEVDVSQLSPAAQRYYRRNR